MSARFGHGCIERAPACAVRWLRFSASTDPPSRVSDMREPPNSREPIPFTGSTRPNGELPEPPDDPRLAEVLRHWRAPAIPDWLEPRILESYRNEISRRPRAPWSHRRLISFAATVALCAAVWWFASEFQGPSLSAAQLLASSTHAEAAEFARPNVVIQRTLSVEERLLPRQVVVTRRRVDIWRRGSDGLTVRRAYDDNSRLVGAEWIPRTGVRTLYR